VGETPRIEMGNTREVVDITSKRQFRIGTWQGIRLVQCDGPRQREIVVDLR
jgi:thiamine phosphate synthase YjbQ (UPF0047 family)